MLGPRSRLRTHDLLSDAAALGCDQPGGRNRARRSLLAGHGQPVRALPYPAGSRPDQHTGFHGRPMSASLTTQQTIHTLSQEGYKYGFVTDIEADTAPPGLSEDTVRFISAKKG